MSMNAMLKQLLASLEESVSSFMTQRKCYGRGQDTQGQAAALTDVMSMLTLPGTTTLSMLYTCGTILISMTCGAHGARSVIKVSLYPAMHSIYAYSWTSGDWLTGQRCNQDASSTSTT